MRRVKLLRHRHWFLSNYHQRELLWWEIRTSYRRQHSQIILRKLNLVEVYLRDFCTVDMIKLCSKFSTECTRVFELGLQTNSTMDLSEIMNPLLKGVFRQFSKTWRIFFKQECYFLIWWTLRNPWTANPNVTMTKLGSQRLLLKWSPNQAPNKVAWRTSVVRLVSLLHTSHRLELSKISLGLSADSKAFAFRTPSRSTPSMHFKEERRK